ncbi:hypothetical protein FACS1894163_13760 [Spirochaetia bacterium]|nr:hypothetical protein FACS1894163_13760 [Spirochaetia bacterium]
MSKYQKAEKRCHGIFYREPEGAQAWSYRRKNLLSFGWEYIVCDIQWYEALAGTEEGEY